VSRKTDWWMCVAASARSRIPALNAVDCSKLSAWLAEPCGARRPGRQATDAPDAAGHPMAPIMAYSSKMASAFYGPFRAASGCDLKGDRKSYQMDPLNGREAIRESLLDEAEGADFLMVKPGMPYLDIIARLRQQTLLPIVAYQVSGEYAMIKFAAAAGALDEPRIVRETLGAIKRAGADLILTYFARDIARQGF
jgi:porphobilinogen synthase